MMNYCRRTLYTLLVCSSAAWAAQEETLIHKPFQDEVLLELGDVVAPNMKGSDRNVQPGVVYFANLMIFMTWDYKDLTTPSKSGERVFTMRCSLKDYKFQKCALLLNDDIYMLLKTQDLQELNQHLAYNMAHANDRSFSPDHNLTWGHSDRASLTTPEGARYCSTLHDDIRWLLAPNHNGYFLKNPVADNVLKMKMIGQWTLRKTMLLQVLSVFDPSIPSSHLNLPDFVYKSSLTKKPNVCVDKDSDKDTDIDTTGSCTHLATVYTQTKQNKFVYNGETDASIPLQLTIKFDPQLGGYCRSPGQHPWINSSNDIEFSTYLTEKPIFE